ncbi:MAG: nucleoside hydrolase [Candidatus Odinarchaeota archaeon]
MRHVIVDTDIGGDPDDLVALFFLLNSPEVSVDLIITADELETHRALFTLEILKILGREDIPVVAGLSNGPKFLFCMYDLVKHSKETVSKDFIAKSLEIIEENDHTYFIGIACMSNLAAIIEERGKVPEKTTFLQMGGMLATDPLGYQEYNFIADPDAARYVFNRQVPVKYITANITRDPAIQITKDHDFFKAVASSDEMHFKLLNDNISNFFTTFSPEFKLHDPLTASVAMGYDFVKFTRKNVKLDLDYYFVEQPDGQEVIVSESCDYGRFMETVRKRLI